jgi:hypothetical protein
VSACGWLSRPGRHAPARAQIHQYFALGARDFHVCAVFNANALAAACVEACVCGDQCLTIHAPSQPCRQTQGKGQPKKVLIAGKDIKVRPGCSRLAGEGWVGLVRWRGLECTACASASATTRLMHFSVRFQPTLLSYLQACGLPADRLCHVMPCLFRRPPSSLLTWA